MTLLERKMIVGFEVELGKMKKLLLSKNPLHVTHAKLRIPVIEESVRQLRLNEAQPGRLVASSYGGYDDETIQRMNGIKV